jgi:hypothetical protein
MMALADFYVATDGSDQWSGTLEAPAPDGSDGPFASLSKARDAVRDRIEKGLRRDVLVCIRGGLHEVAEPVIFGPQDSPGSRFSVTYAAYPGERPVFSAATPVRGWHEPAGRELPDGLPEEAARNVFVADLAGCDVARRFYALYDGDEVLPRARGNGFVPRQPEEGGPEPDKRTVLFPEGHLRDWPNLEDIELVIRPQHPWVVNILPLESVDEEGCWARTALSGTYDLKQLGWGGDEGKPTAWVENAPECLTQPGEWMLDSQKGKLYLWPRGSGPGDRIRAARTREIVRVDGGGKDAVPVQNITFRGLTFRHGDRDSWTIDGAGLQHDWEMFDKDNALLRLRGAENCVVEHCAFEHSAGTGVRLDLHCQDNRVEACRFSHLGGTGVLLCGFGPGRIDVNHHNKVRENRIHDCGEIYWHSAGIFVWQSGHNRIAHNLVRDMPYNGIVISGVRPNFFTQPERRECGRTIRFEEIGGVGPRAYESIWPLLHARQNLCEYNEIHDVMQVLRDGNGIYISGTGPGNVIRCNFVHDIFACQSGIRTDDWQFDTVLEGNVICRCVNAGFILKGVNRIENNVVACLATTGRQGEEVPVQGHVALRHISKNHPTSAGSRVFGNIFYHTGNQPVFFEEHRAPIELAELDVDFNVYCCRGDQEAARDDLEDRRREGIDGHSVAADPLFMSPEEDDFRLSPESPAWKLGICPVDVRETGPSGQGQKKRRS